MIEKSNPSHLCTKSERNLQQIEKDAQAIIFGERKFHNYLCGRLFHLHSDHSGSKSSSTNSNSSQNATRRSNCTDPQRLNYQVKYWPSKEQGHADALSRLPWNKTPLKEEAEILFFSGLEELPIDAEKDISGETRRDLVVESLNIGTTEIRCSYLSCVFYQFCKRWIKAELYEGYPSNIGHHWFARVSFKS